MAERDYDSSTLREFLKHKVFGKVWFSALLIAPAVVFFAFLIARLDVLSNLEMKLLDTKFNLRPLDTTFKQRSQVVLIGITDQAQQAVQSFPWPRDYHARIIRNLHRAGAKVIAFDLMFDEVDKRGGDAAFRAAAAEAQNVVVAGREPTSMTEGRQVEYKSLGKVDYVTIFDGSPGTTVGNVYVRQDNDGVLRRYHPASANVLGNQFLSFAYAILKVYFQTSDSLRYEEGDFVFAGKRIPSFDGESVLLNPYGPSHAFPEISAENILDDREFMTKFEYEQFQQVMKETGLDSLSLVRNEELRDLWATDLFDDPLSGIQEQVRGKICIIGPMFPEAKDDFPTSMWTDGRPDQNKMYGVEIHATAVQNFIDGQFIRVANPFAVIGVLLLLSYVLFVAAVSIKRVRIPNQKIMLFVTIGAMLLALYSASALTVYILGANPLQYFLSLPLTTQLLFVGSTIAGSIAAAFGFKRAGTMQEFSVEVLSLLLSVGLFVAAYQYSIYHFVEDGVLIYAIPFATTIAFSYAATILYQYFTESRQKKLIKGFFNAYVPPALVEQMLANPDSFKLGGERRELTMFFSDIKGFTNISEGYKDNPEKLVELLNEYLGTMTDIIFKYGGTLDKYIGDAVVAFWNAPLPVEDHAKQACWAALEMQETLKKLREKWIAEGKPPIYSRMGINTGTVIVGNMGSQSRFAYTAMGDAMNLAARLEAANKAFGTSIMISQYTYERVKDYCLCRELATITVQGKAEPIKVYELVGRKEPGKVYEELPPAETASKGILAIAKD
ncbi:MAG: adenylate/guanylate cyclase domain-containing protein [Chloroherpetonaceae bacterium]|nr:adenylate/guanylate cyclase domain-containing protein [Chloroherpetonaceae bacterium]MCS7211887.1 adenylate/guanylate cyclase domain-containing protein [Chloroherpetonaceae bacterium]MDW8019673.1 adenylate/guanylate cyclase domain-containing protein [Chloroherpetonaceae bacterium]